MSSFLSENRVALASFLTPQLMETVGLSAAFLTTACWVPQAIKTIRSRETKSISLVTQVLLNVGILCWLAYGLYLGDLPLILSNAVTFLFVATILAMKLRYG